MRGTSCSQAVQDAQNDLAILRAPHVKRFTKKNSVFPFEDPASLECMFDGCPRMARERRKRKC